MPHEMTDPIPLDYAEPERRSLAARLVRAARRCLIAYFIVSLVTLPFVDAWWIGELPVLALVQVPKTALAGWLRADLVVPLIRLVGLSAGSFSPDYLLARPYALALAYGLVVGPASAPWRAGGRRARGPAGRVGPGGGRGRRFCRHPFTRRGPGTDPLLTRKRLSATAGSR